MINNHTNWEDLKKQQNHGREQFRAKSRQVDDQANEEPTDYNNKKVHELTTREKILLLRDVAGSMKPPLTNLIRTHNPTSHLTMHPQTGTALGKLDVIG